VRIRQATEEDAVDDAEDGSGSSDGESERGDDHQGESRALDEDAQGAANVVPEAFDAERGIFGGDALAHGGGTAEAALLHTYKTQLRRVVSTAIFLTLLFYVFYVLRM